MKIIKTESIEEICNLHPKIFYRDFPIDSYYKKKQLYDEIHLYLYLKDGKYIGYSIVIFQKDLKNLHAWYGGLLPEYQGKGLNNIFWDFLIKSAKNIGYKTITLATTNKRPKMIIQAVKKGFEIYDLKKRENGEGNKIYFKYFV